MKISNIVSTLVLGATIILSGCGSDDDSSMDEEKVSYQYSVSVTNLTAGQPMSPLLVSSYPLFSVGESASDALELQAEGGDNSKLLDAYSVSGTGLLTPGSSESITLDSMSQKISFTTMLVKTNDAFTGVDSYDVSDLSVGESTTLYTNVYDAGTEVNLETKESVPGLMGEGYNSARESADIITLHSGVISNEDGLATSDLSAMEKFNNPASMVVITRVQ